jgi:REP element-mobilizing transposase RayT
MNYDPDIHHRRSIRLREYDYRGAGAYFVTICTFKRECLFGEVVNGEMQLTDAGFIAVECWQGIPDHFSHVELDEFVAMPNHVHGIIVLDDSMKAHVGALVGAQHAAPLPSNVIPGSLSAIIRSFKSAATKRINEIRKNSCSPVWQRNYYEHVIRNKDDLARIRRYLAENPSKWELDENTPANVR